MATTPDATDGPYLPEHIVVLVHGNNGSGADFNAVAKALVATFGGPQELLVIQSRANEADTSLGVETGGNRLAKEVVEAVFEYEVRPIARQHKVSLVAHSLGGLYARYALVQIMKAMSCLHVAYVNFVTICTPHLGSRRARGPSTVKVRSCSWWELGSRWLGWGNGLMALRCCCCCCCCDGYGVVGSLVDRTWCVSVCTKFWRHGRSMDRRGSICCSMVSEDGVGVL